MSTRSSIAFGKGFHFYHDLGDEDEAVYLKLEHADFEATKDEVTVRIPIEIWEYIRHKGAATLNLVNATDEDLQKKVEADVDERIAEYAAEKNKRLKAFLGFFGSLVYGNAEEPREIQVQQGIEYWTKERERQSQVASKIAVFEKAEGDRRQGVFADLEKEGNSPRNA